ncbi:MAG: hypothetical protein FWG27_06990 [Treponema sp.]|jgi:hypothetical protein|nr:hypothetical protein [Treponema sp.]
MKLLFTALFLAVVLSCGGKPLPGTDDKTAAGETPTADPNLKIEIRPEGSIPIAADLKTMLHHPCSFWRNPEYEIFSHNLYPSLLYLITENFAVQSRFLKRIAFFTEKPGFAGRLARDEEISGLRDWFAHDYRARDLAAFFDLAREQIFPLNEDEIFLRDLLVSQGIIRNERGRYTEGEGALLGFSIESRDRLPVYFAHETVHGLIFIMPELQDFFVNFFDSLSTKEKEFLRDALTYREYNVLEDPQLLAFETAAYLLQQPPEETDQYFRDYIMIWYSAFHKGNTGAFTAFLAANPGIFGRRSAVLQKEFEALTGLRTETFYDLLPKDRSL